MFGLAKLAAEYKIGDRVSFGGTRCDKYNGIITEVDDDIVEVVLPDGEKKVVDIDGLAKKAAAKKQKFEEIQHGYIRDGVKYGVSISKDKDGYFAHTHRARCKSYPSIDAIPVSKLKFIDSTG